MNEIKDMTKKERAEMWQQVAAYVEQLERAVETQRAQLKRRQERINALKARARAERTSSLKLFMGQNETADILEGVCSKCSAFMDSQMRFCPNCGAKVVDTDD